ncbi:MAG TPA: PilN domain-containing protein [Pyrinomonadaceae bacterium]|nr:PilN domain-containing protein [Pyrinomonadaceae bacterium]
MIRVNLLQSVTERHHGAAASVERKVGSAASRLLLMSLAVAFLLSAVIGWDVISTQMAKVDAEKRLEEQKRIATELEAVMKEQKELETKITAIDARINAIKDLRSKQAGPSAVLEALRERITMTPGIYLDSVEQKGDQLEIRGTSNEEAAPTQFGKSLEFSNGLFSNLSIETARKEDPIQATPTATTPTNPAEAPKNVSFTFTIRCAYTPSKAAQPNGATTASTTTTAPQQPQNQAATQPQPQTGGNPPQVAKN